MKITTFILLIAIYKVVTIHLNLNKKENRKSVSATPSNVVDTKNNFKNNDIIKDNDNDEKLNDDTSIDTIKMVKSIEEIEEKQKIKNIEKPITNGTDELVKDTIFTMTEERLSAIDKDEEDQEAILAKLSFKQNLNVEDEQSDDGMVEVDYEAILDNNYKIDLAEKIQSQEDFKWYDNAGINLESNLKIEEKKHKVIQYNY